MKYRRSLRTLFLSLIGLLLFTVSLAAQGGGQGNPPGGGGGGGGGRGGGGTDPGGRPPGSLPGAEERQRQGMEQMPQSIHEMRRPLFIMGKVVMEDGAPPPETLLINRVCSGIVRPEGYTDSKGRFSFELGRNTAVFADASVSNITMGGWGDPRAQRQMEGGITSQGPTGGLSERDLIGCEIQAYLPGYRSDAVMLTGRRLLDNPDVGTIILHRVGNVEGTTISFTSIGAPKDAKKAFEKGRDAMRKQKLDDALKHLEKAVGLYPQYAAAWFDLGRVHEFKNNLPEARKAYEQALAADAKFVSPYMQIAGLAAREQNWKGVLENTDRVVKLNPVDFPAAYYFNAVANYNLRNLDGAEKSAREGLKADTQHRFPKMSHLMGVILAQKQDLAGAAQHMKKYLELAPNANDASLVKSQLAELERLMGQTAAKPKQ